jgi:hypothetical protein
MATKKFQLEKNFHDIPERGDIVQWHPPPCDPKWDYLDQIWTATETADSTDLTVLPALMVRDRQTKAASA